MTKLDWTHLGVMIDDIRKLNKLYVIKLKFGGAPVGKNLEGKEPINSSLFVSEKIFEERIKSYFLKDISQINREDILNVPWNMYITKGYYVKVEDLGTGQNEIVRHDQDSNKYYVSFLEIAGPLGTFCSIYRDKELNKS